MFWQIGFKTKTSSDLLENLHSRYIEVAEYKSYIGILQLFIQILNLDKLVPKLKSCWIS